MPSQPWGVRTSTSASSWLASTSCQFWSVPPQKNITIPRITSQYRNNRTSEAEKDRTGPLPAPHCLYSISHPILRRHCRQGCNLSATVALLLLYLKTIASYVHILHIYIYHCRYLDRDHWESLHFHQSSKCWLFILANWQNWQKYVWINVDPIPTFSSLNK